MKFFFDLLGAIGIAVGIVIFWIAIPIFGLFVGTLALIAFTFMMIREYRRDTKRKEKGI